MQAEVPDCHSSNAAELRLAIFHSDNGATGLAYNNMQNAIETFRDVSNGSGNCQASCHIRHPAGVMQHVRMPVLSDAAAGGSLELLA